MWRWYTSPRPSFRFKKPFRHLHNSLKYHNLTRGTLHFVSKKLIHVLAVEHKASISYHLRSSAFLAEGLLQLLGRALQLPQKEYTPLIAIMTSLLKKPLKLALIQLASGKW